MTIQLRRGLAATIPTLADGQPGFTTDTFLLYIGYNGTNRLIGPGGGGTVTSFSAGNLSPLFTSSVATETTTPALTFALSTQTANYVFAGPTSGGAAAPTFRALVAADIPSLATSAIGSGFPWRIKAASHAITSAGALVDRAVRSRSRRLTSMGYFLDWWPVGVTAI